MQNRARFDEIDIIKGIAMLTVIWNHSFILYPIYMLDIPWCKHAMSINETYFMNVFFMVSGYLFAHSRKRNLKDNIKQKFKRLIVPYLSFSFVTLLLKLAMPDLVNRKVNSIWSYIDNLLFHGGELWFVYVLFIIFIIWHSILPLMRERTAWAVLVILYMIDFICPDDFLNGLFLIKKVIHYSTFFLIGYNGKNILRKLVCKKESFAILSVLFLVFCCIIVECEYISYVYKLIQGLIGCGFIWILSTKITRNKNLNNALSFIGKYSLPYYWTNGIALVLARTVVVNHLGFKSTITIVISIFILCILLQTASILIARRLPRVSWIIGI